MSFFDNLFGRQEQIIKSPVADTPDIKIPAEKGNPEKWFDLFFTPEEKASMANAARNVAGRAFAIVNRKDNPDNKRTQQFNTQATPTPTPIPPEQDYKFKYSGVINRVSQKFNLPLKAFHLLRASENMGEDPEAINHNSNGTLDIGLFQINVASDNTREIENLKNPEYNATRAGEIFAQRLEVLKDPVLALASYNLGAGGAVLNPDAAMKRAAWVYWKAGLEMPETEFTKDPLGYVRKNMQYYKERGLFK